MGRKAQQATIHQKQSTVQNTAMWNGGASSLCIQRHSRLYVTRGCTCSRMLRLSGVKTRASGAATPSAPAAWPRGNLSGASA